MFNFYVKFWDETSIVTRKLFSGIFLIDETFIRKSLVSLIQDLHFWAWNFKRESTTLVPDYGKEMYNFY